MRNELDVVNACLATMGERPLSTINEPHAWVGAALRQLEKSNSDAQDTGRWFNTENKTVVPTVGTGFITFTEDIVGVRTYSRDYILRGNRLYDLVNGTFVFTASLDILVVRLIPFVNLPGSAQRYVEAQTVLMFQGLYDADPVKTRELAVEAGKAAVMFNAENTRHDAGNLITGNARLQRLKFYTRNVRTPIR